MWNVAEIYSTRPLMAGVQSALECTVAAQREMYASLHIFIFMRWNDSKEYEKTLQTEHIHEHKNKKNRTK